MMLDKYFTSSIIKLETFSFTLFRSSNALFRSFSGLYLDFITQFFKCPGGLRLRTGLSTTGDSLKVRAQGYPLHGDQPALLPDLAEGQVLD